MRAAAACSALASELAQLVKRGELAAFLAWPQTVAQPWQSGPAAGLRPRGSELPGACGG